MENHRSIKNKGSPNILLNFLKKRKPNEENKEGVTEHQNTQQICVPEDIQVQVAMIDEPYDIANFVFQFIESDERKIHILHNIWVPNDNFLFPLDHHHHETHRRKFNYSWLRKFSWLAYSKKLDGAFCKYCVLFASQFAGQSSSQSLGSLCNEP